jgi:N-acetyl sugar amidotransferase
MNIQKRMKREYQVCTRCVMDTSDKEITFNKKGECNHCAGYDMKMESIPKNEVLKKKELNRIVKEIKKTGKGKEYDCISGVSGGVDSTYLTYMLKELGLRVLVVHLDNGWNTELAVKNIENIVTRLDFDLYTNVLDWQQFKNLQVAYLKASVLDLEALSDHAIFATLYKTADKYNIKYIINGSNLVTEGILPLSWRYDRKLTDAVNIKSIYKRFWGKKIKNFPLTSIQKFAYYMKVKKIKSVDLLNFLPYEKNEAKRLIMEKLDWKDYGGKHYESIITRFYQGYILPNKFGIDKRRAHLATLVASKQMTREDALTILKTPTLPEEILRQDIEYVPKKLGLSPKEFEEIMKQSPKNHEDYPTDLKLRNLLFGINKRISKKNNE